MIVIFLIAFEVVRFLQIYAATGTERNLPIGRRYPSRAVPSAIIDQWSNRQTKNCG